MRILATGDELELCLEQCDCGNLGRPDVISSGWGDCVEEDSPIAYFCFFKICKCPACNGVFIVEYSSAIFVPDLVVRQDPRADWQRRVLYSSARPAVPDIPSQLSTMLSEARAIRGTSPRGSVMLCRSILEEVCYDHGIVSSRSLKWDIEELGTKLRFDERLTRILSHLRVVGNKVAHENHAFVTSKVGSEEVDTVLSVVAMVLERVYCDEARIHDAESLMQDIEARLKGHE